MSSVSPEYLAGFFDGEGSIMIIPTGLRTPDGHRASWSLKCSIPQVDLNVLVKIQQSWGGKFSAVQPPIESKNQRQIYKIQWFGAEAEKVLRSIYPHLILKRRRAELAFEFREMQKATGHKSGGGKRNPEVKGQLNVIAMEVKALNKRGISK